MIKYTEYEVTFEEIPSEVTLCVNISNCHCRCPGCHSPHLWEDIGEPLNLQALNKMISSCKDFVTCIVLMGGDASPEEINQLALIIKELFRGLKVGWYSGRTILSDKIDISRFDYIKLGPYIEELGPLNKPTTNQRLYKVVDKKLVDITSQFWTTAVLTND